MHWYIPDFNSPNIDWKLLVSINRNDPTYPLIVVEGERDDFPAYEIIVQQSDGSYKKIYYWTPPVNIQVGIIPVTTVSPIIAIEDIL